MTFNAVPKAIQYLIVVRDYIQNLVVLVDLVKELFMTSHPVVW